MRPWVLRSALIGLCGLTLAGCGRLGGRAPKGAPVVTQGDTEFAPPVSVVTAVRGPIRQVVRVTGTVRAVREVEVAPEGSGRVTAVYADVGDRVSKGSLLLRFDTDLLQAQARQADAGLDAAAARLKQARDTVELTSSTTGISVEQARKQLDAARSQLAKAETAAATTETSVNNRIAQAQLAVRSAETQLAEVRRGAREQQKKQAQAQLEIAQAGYDFAKSQYEVKKRLYTHGAASGTEFGQALAEFQQARAALEQARQQLSLVEEGPTAEQVRLAELQVEQAKEQLRLAEAQRDQIALAREDVELARTQVRLAEDQLELARAGTGEVTVRQSDIAAAQAGVKQARAARDLAYTTLRKHRVYSPVTGLVAARLVEPGEFASPSSSVFRIVDLSNVYIHAVISESDVVKVRKGQEAEVTTPGLVGTQLKGRVVDIAPASMDHQRNFVARILVPNKGELLRPGMSASVTLIVGVNLSAILVPRDAIVEDQGKRLVYAVEEGRIKVRSVKIGAEERGRVEIISGVQEGDVVVVVGQSDLADGQKVRPVPREGGAR